MIKELSELLQSRTRALEIMLVKEGIKPCARLALPDESFLSALDELGLKHALADFKIQLEFRGCYSTKGNKIPADSPEEGHRFVYVAREQKTADHAKQCEASGNIQEFGKALGYPKCCVDFFIKNREKQIKSENDYVLPSIQNSKEKQFPFHLNVFARYFDFCLVSHAPHALDCKPSLEIAKNVMNYLVKTDQELAMTYQRFMSGVGLYLEDGVVYLPLARMSGKDLVFNRVLSAPTKHPSALLLSRNGKAQIVDGILYSDGTEIPLLGWASFA